MEDNQMITTISVETDALRLLHRAVSEAYTNWSGGDANEQACLLNMKTQLYAALLDHLLESGSCLLYTSPSPRDLSTSRMPSSA